jgi:hypothetical protein
MIFEPKAEVYSILSTVTVEGLDINVYQARPEIIESFPSVTFFISSNVPSYDLSREVGPQDIEVTVDIWAETSSDSGLIFKAVESAMKESDYRLTFSTDVADPDGISHINTVFNLVG